MSDKSAIEWTEATWNPLVGCTKVSSGCDHCYAETLVNRFAGHHKAFPNRFDVVTIRDERTLTQPLRWARPRKVFVNSLSDLFHADVPTEFVARVFAVMALAPQHTFQLLTKRHGRMRSVLTSVGFAERVWWEAGKLALTRNRAGKLATRPGLDSSQVGTWPLPNVWLGVSVEDQHWADVRIPVLLKTPAAVRWLSCEPLLGPVDLRAWLPGQPTDKDQASLAASIRAAGLPDFTGDSWLRLFTGTGIDWVVTGGESGPGARAMHPSWARDLRDQCEHAGIAFLHKQNGAYLPDPDGTERAVDTEGREYPGRLRRAGKKAAGRQLDGRTHDAYPGVA